MCTFRRYVLTELASWIQIATNTSTVPSPMPRRMRSSSGRNSRSRVRVWIKKFNSESTETGPRKCSPERSINWKNHEFIFVSLRIYPIIQSNTVTSVNTEHFTHSRIYLYLRFTAKCSTLYTCYSSASITIRLFRVRIVIVFIRSSWKKKNRKHTHTPFIISLKSKSDMTFLAYLNWFPPRLRSILMPSWVL